MLREIWMATKKGWMSGGIKWREEFVAKDIDPDKFLALPDGSNLLQQYLKLAPQAKVQFLNILTRRDHLFDLIKIN